MPSLRQGDIVFAYFPYKKFLAAKITTTQLNRSWAVHLKAGNYDMISGHLQTESWINLNRREKIPFSDYIFTIRTLKRDIMQYIINKIILQRT